MKQLRDSIKALLKEKPVKKDDDSRNLIRTKTDGLNLASRFMSTLQVFNTDITSSRRSLQGKTPDLLPILKVVALKQR